MANGWVSKVVDGLTVQYWGEVPELDVDESTTGSFFCRFVDYDGSVLSEQTFTAGSSAIAPTTPTHSGLTFYGWNNAYEDISESVEVGAIYYATDSKTKIKMRLTAASGLAPTLYVNKSDTSTLTVDWGDSTTTDVTASGNTNSAHTYSAAGTYVITMWISSGTGTYALGNTGNVALFATTYARACHEVVIGEDVPSLLSRSFNLSGLESVVIPNTVTSIADEAFYGAVNLKGMNIPSSVTTITGSVMTGCVGLMHFVVPAGTNVTYGSTVSGCNSLRALILGSCTTLNYAGLYALEYVKLPNGVGNTVVLSDAYTLKQLVIPANVTTLQLANANSLKLLDARGNITSVILTNCYRIREFTFAGTTLAADAFKGCYSLERVTAPNLTTIGANAFQYCYSLEEAPLPNTVTSIGAYAFSDCISLKKVTIPTNGLNVTGYQFQNCYSLDEVTFSSAAYCAPYIFSGCSALRKVTFEAGVSGSWGGDVFKNCVSLQSMDVPNLTIGNRFLGGCTSLRSASLPAGMTATPGYCFQGCKALQAITFGESLTNISTYTFDGAGFVELTLPEGVTTLSNYAVQGNTNLQYLDLPSTMTTIATSSIASCTNLRVLICRATTPPTYVSAAITANGGLKIYVPDASVAAYKAATNWSALATYIMPLSDWSL